MIGQSIGQTIVSMVASLAVLSCSSVSYAGVLDNSSFESPVIGPPTYPSAPYNFVYPGGSLGGWTFSPLTQDRGSNSGAGIINAASTSAWWGHGWSASPAAAPSGFHGKQYAFIQTAGSLSQTFVAPSSGQFVATWLQGSRAALGIPPASYDGEQTYRVLIDATAIGTYSAHSGQDFRPTSSSPFNLVKGDRYRLTFQGTTTGFDHTAFIDLVDIRPAGAYMATQAASTAPPAVVQTPLDKLMASGPLPELSFGSPSAPVTVVAYISLTCKECAASFPDKYQQLKARYIDTGQLRFVAREFAVTPLDAAGFLLSRCAGDESKIFAFIQTLMQRRSEWFVQRPLEPLKAIAKEAGMDAQRIDACLANQELLDKISSIRARGHQDLGVTGVPVFFVNGRKFEGQADWGSPLLAEVTKSLKPYDELYCGVTTDVMPDDASGFMNWCEQRGFSARDFQGATCNAAVGSAVGARAWFGKGRGCEVLKNQSDAVKTNDAYEGPFTRPIYQWLRAHPEKVRGRWVEALMDAIDGMYGCRSSESGR
jgi:protein-disulfide isomerase